MPNIDTNKPISGTLFIPTKSSNTSSPYDLPTSHIASKEFDSYTKYIQNPTRTMDLDYARAKNQSTWEKVGITAGNLIPNIAFGVIENFGYLGALASEWGTEQDYSNFMVEAAQQSRNPFGGTVYSKPTDKSYDLTDAGWYTNTIGGLVESIGEFVASSYIVGGVIGKVGGMLNSVKAGSTAARGISAIEKLSSSALLSQLESAQIANGVYKDLYSLNYNKLKMESYEKSLKGEQGLSDSEIHELAKEQASTGAKWSARVNTTLITPLNLTGLSAIFKNSAYLDKMTMLKKTGALRKIAGETDEIYKARLASIVPDIKAMPMGKKLGLEGGQEWIEEQFANNLAEGIGRNKGGEDYDTAGRIFSAQGLIDGILGAIGGVGQSAIMENIAIHKTYNEETKKFEQLTSREAEVKERISQFNEFRTNTIHDIDNMQTILTNLAKAETPQERSIYQQQLENVFLTKNIGTGTASNLIGSYEYIRDMDNTTPIETRKEKDANGNEVEIPVTKAMKEGLASSPQDNEYKTKAEQAIQRFKDWDKKYLDYTTKYNITAEDKAAHLGENLLVHEMNKENYQLQLNNINARISELENEFNTVDAKNNNVELSRVREINTKIQALKGHIEEIMATHAADVTELDGHEFLLSAKYGIPVSPTLANDIKNMNQKKYDLANEEINKLIEKQNTLLANTTVGKEYLIKLQEFNKLSNKLMSESFKINFQGKRTAKIKARIERFNQLKKEVDSIHEQLNNSKNVVIDNLLQDEVSINEYLQLSRKQLRVKEQLEHSEIMSTKLKNSKTRKQFTKAFFDRQTAVYDEAVTERRNLFNQGIEKLTLDNQDSDLIESLRTSFPEYSSMLDWHLKWLNTKQEIEENDFSIKNKDEIATEIETQIDKTIQEVTKDLSNKETDIKQIRQEELETLKFDESTQQRLDAYKNKDIERYRRELIIAADRIEEGRKIVNKHKAEDIINNENSSIAERIMAKRFLKDNTKPFSEAMITDIERNIHDELSTVNIGEGKAQWNDDLRELKKLYDEEIKNIKPKTKSETQPKSNEPSQWVIDKVNAFASHPNFKEAKDSLIKWATHLESINNAIRNNDLKSVFESYSTYTPDLSYIKDIINLMTGFPNNLYVLTKTALDSNISKILDGGNIMIAGENVATVKGYINEIQELLNAKDIKNVKLLNSSELKNTLSTLNNIDITAKVENLKLQYLAIEKELDIPVVDDNNPIEDNGVVEDPNVDHSPQDNEAKYRSKLSGVEDKLTSLIIPASTTMAYVELTTQTLTNSKGDSRKVNKYNKWESDEVHISENMFQLNTGSIIRIKVDTLNTEYGTFRNESDNIPLMIESKINGKWTKVGYIRKKAWVGATNDGLIKSANNKYKNVAGTTEHIENQIKEISQYRKQIVDLLETQPDGIFSNIVEKEEAHVSKVYETDKNGIVKVTENTLQPILNKNNTIWENFASKDVDFAIAINRNLVTGTDFIGGKEKLADLNINNYFKQKLINKKDLSIYEKSILDMAENNQLTFKIKDDYIDNFSGYSFVILPTSNLGQFTAYPVYKGKLGQITGHQLGINSDKTVGDFLMDLVFVYTSRTQESLDKLNEVLQSKQLPTLSFNNDATFHYYFDKFINRSTKFDYITDKQGNKKLRPTFNNNPERIALDEPQFIINNGQISYKVRSKEYYLSGASYNSENITKVQDGLKAALNNAILSFWASNINKADSFALPYNEDGNWKLIEFSNVNELYARSTKTIINGLNIIKETGQPVYFEHPNIHINMDNLRLTEDTKITETTTEPITNTTEIINEPITTSDLNEDIGDFSLGLSSTNYEDIDSSIQAQKEGNIINVNEGFNIESLATDTFKTTIENHTKICK